MKTKLLSLLLVLTMISTIVPTAVTANEPDDIIPEITLSDDVISVVEETENKDVEISSDSQESDDEISLNSESETASLQTDVIASDDGSEYFGGMCGSDVYWEFDGAVLTIYGNGDMENWASASATPWYSLRTEINEIIIQEGVTRVGSYAFTGFSSLAKVSLPNTLTFIGNSSFNGCKLITSLYIPENVTNIGWSAFYGCLALQEVELYPQITTIGSSAFNNCRKLTDVYFHGTQNDWDAISIGANNTYLLNASLYTETPVTNYCVTFFSDDGKIIESMYIEEGSNIPYFPDFPIKDGYTFLGWFDGDTPITEDTAIYGDISAIAMYEKKSDISIWRVCSRF